MEGIGIGEFKITSSANTLRINGLGSCLGVALYDMEAGLAGLIHIKRPSPDGNENTLEAKFADPGVELLIEAMEKEGASRHRIEAKLAGGSNMSNFSVMGTNIAAENVNEAEFILQEKGIPIVGRDVGGDQARSLEFDGETGELTVQNSNGTSTI